MDSSTSLLRIALLALTLLLAACANKFGPGQLARDWSCKMREMQIAPVFPPREDIQVGDVYWLHKIGETDANAYCSGSPSGGDFVPIPLHLGYVPEVMRAADAHYKSRPDFPTSSLAAGTVSLSTSSATITFAPVSTAVVEGSDTLFVSGRAHRTRLVGFPDFMSVKIDRKSLGAIVPIQGVFTPFGISTEDVDDASISIPVAESYGVPFASAWEALQGASAKAACKAAASVARSRPKGSGSVVLVYEVFYTRAIDVSIQSRSSVALSIARDRQGAVTTSVPSVTNTGIATPSASVTPQGSTAVSSLAAVAQGVVQILGSRNSVPGVSFSTEQGRASAINMRRVFDRPVAIGQRFLEITPNDDGTTCTFEWAGLPTGSGSGLSPMEGKTEIQIQK